MQIYAYYNAKQICIIKICFDVFTSVKCATVVNRLVSSFFFQYQWDIWGFTNIFGSICKIPPATYTIPSPYPHFPCKPSTFHEPVVQRCSLPLSDCDAVILVLCGTLHRPDCSLQFLLVERGQTLLCDSYCNFFFFF